MLSNNVLNLLNSQITAEFEASQLYLQMASWFEKNNYLGFAKYLRDESCNERSHGLKMYDYILKQLGYVNLETINQPKQDWETCEDIFSDILEQEKKVTGLIYNINKIAMIEGDFATISFLQWFVDEQVKSESEADYNYNIIKYIDNDIGALLDFDKTFLNDSSVTVSLSI